MAGKPGATHLTNREPLRRQARALYERHGSIRAVASQLGDCGVCYGTARRLLIEAGTALYGPGHPDARTPRTPPARIP